MGKGRLDVLGYKRFDGSAVTPAQSVTSGSVAADGSDSSHGTHIIFSQSYSLIMIQKFPKWNKTMYIIFLFGTVKEHEFFLGVEFWRRCGRIKEGKHKVRITPGLFVVNMLKLHQLFYSEEKTFLSRRICGSFYGCAGRSNRYSSHQPLSSSTLP